MCIKTTPKLLDQRQEKGVVIEINGPSHYYNPGQNEMTNLHKTRISKIEAAGFKVFMLHHLGNE